MSEGLEALKRIKPYADSSIRADCELIEKELKEYQLHEEILNEYGLTPANFREACLLYAQWKSAGLCWADYEKQKKALEIIKNIGILKPYETSGGQCWLETMCDAIKITKDNYDLLKEVLL